MRSVECGSGTHRRCSINVSHDGFSSICCLLGHNYSNHSSSGGDELPPSFGSGSPLPKGAAIVLGEEPMVKSQRPWVLLPPWLLFPGTSGKSWLYWAETVMADTLREALGW